MEQKMVNDMERRLVLQLEMTWKSGDVTIYPDPSWLPFRSLQYVLLSMLLFAPAGVACRPVRNVQLGLLSAQINPPYTTVRDPSSRYDGQICYGYALFKGAPPNPLPLKKSQCDNVACNTFM